MLLTKEFLYGLLAAFGRFILKTRTGWNMTCDHDDESFIAELTALLSGSKTSYLLKQRGLAYRRLQDFDAALEDFNHGLEIEIDPEIYKFRGELYIQIGNLDAAERDLKHYMDYHKPFLDPFALRHYGEVKRLQGDHEMARNYFRSSLKMDGHNTFALSGYAETLRLLGKTEKALKYFEKALKISPNHSQALTGRGWIRVVRGHLPEAMVDFHEALREDPDNACAKEGFQTAVRQFNHHQSSKATQEAQGCSS